MNRFLGRERTGRSAVLAVLVVGALLALALPSPAPAQRPQRYSGRVVTVDPVRDVVVVEELAERGRRVRHEFHVSDATPVVSVGRRRLGDMRGRSAYGEAPASAADLVVGDFVTVEASDAGGVSVALRITIVETPRRTR